jgi:hypothetical protein
MNVDNWWVRTWHGKLKYSKKTRHLATWFTIDPTWPDLGSNLGRRCGKPGTMSHVRMYVSSTEENLWLCSQIEEHITRESHCSFI